MDNSLLAVRDINHKYIVVGGNNMKSTFKKAFGVILGIYAGCVAVEIISKFGKTYLKVEKPAEKETDESEEESI